MICSPSKDNQFPSIHTAHTHHVGNNRTSQQDSGPFNISQSLARNPHRFPRYPSPPTCTTTSKSLRQEQTGDDSTLQNSRKFARDSFDQNRRFKAGSIEAEKAVEHAQGVAQILRENVVQGSTDKEESETYSESQAAPTFDDENKNDH